MEGEIGDQDADLFRLLQEVVEVVEEIITDGAIQLLDAGQADEIRISSPNEKEALAARPY